MLKKSCCLERFASEWIVDNFENDEDLNNIELKSDGVTLCDDVMGVLWCHQFDNCYLGCSRRQFPVFTIELLPRLKKEVSNRGVTNVTSKLMG